MGAILLILIFVVPTVLTMGALGVERQRRASGACGACGYSTVGLPSDVCPECGSTVLLEGSVEKCTWTPSPVMRGVCIALLTLVVWWLAFLCVVERGEHMRDVLEFQVESPDGLWSAKFKSVGTRRVDEWGFGAIRRERTDVTLRTSKGEKLDLRLVDVMRRAEYRDAAGERIRTDNSISADDIGRWAGGIRDAAARESVLSATDSLLHCLELGPSGTPCVTGRKLAVRSEDHARYEVPAGHRIAVGAAFMLAFPAMAIWRVRKYPERRLIVWKGR